MMNAVQPKTPDAVMQASSSPSSPPIHHLRFFLQNLNSVFVQKVYLIFEKKKHFSFVKSRIFFFFEKKQFLREMN